MKRDSFTDRRGDEYLFEMYSAADLRITKKARFGKARETSFIKVGLSDEATSRLKVFLNMPAKVACEESGDDD